MKRELVPFNDMFTVTGSVEVYRIHSRIGKNTFVLSNIRNPKDKITTNDPTHLGSYTIDTINVADAFDKFYEIEMESELPAPEELSEMKALGELIGCPTALPISVCKVLTMYYNIMEVADDFDDLMDPYDQMAWDNLDSSDLDKPLDHHIKI